MRQILSQCVNPYNPGDSYTVNMLQRYPDMTYNQAMALVERAYRSVHLHENQPCIEAAKMVASGGYDPKQQANASNRWKRAIDLHRGPGEARTTSASCSGPCRNVPTWRRNWLSPR